MITCLLLRRQECTPRACTCLLLHRKECTARLLHHTRIFFLKILLDFVYRCMKSIHCLEWDSYLRCCTTLTATLKHLLLTNKLHWACMSLHSQSSVSLYYFALLDLLALGGTLADTFHCSDCICLNRWECYTTIRHRCRVIKSDIHLEHCKGGQHCLSGCLSRQWRAQSVYGGSSVD